MASFTVGKSYRATDCALTPIKIISRTAHTIKANTEWATWTMRVKVDEDGNEYAADSTAPKYWREACTYRAIWEEEE